MTQRDKYTAVYQCNILVSHTMLQMQIHCCPAGGHPADAILRLLDSVINATLISVSFVEVDSKK